MRVRVAGGQGSNNLLSIEGPSSTCAPATVTPWADCAPHGEQVRSVCLLPRLEHAKGIKIIPGTGKINKPSSI